MLGGTPPPRWQFEHAAEPRRRSPGAGAHIATMSRCTPIEMGGDHQLNKKAAYPLMLSVITQREAGRTRLRRRCDACAQSAITHA